MDDRELWQMRRDITALQEWKQEREDERLRFRESWSDMDINKLRGMLNGYTTQRAVSGFLQSTWGKFATGALVFAALGTFALELYQVIK